MIDTPLCEGTEIFTYYKLMAIQKVIGKNLVVLKTDLYNESERQANNKNILKFLSPHIVKGYAVEVDIGVYREAVEVMWDYTNLELIHGSIANLPLDDNSIDLLLDLSTIDHVEDYEKVLCEYERVVKPDGELVIIVWLTNGEDQESYSTQYCFNQEGFEERLKKYFTITQRQLLLSNGVNIPIEGRRLVEYGLGILRK